MIRVRRHFSSVYRIAPLLVCCLWAACSSESGSGSEDLVDLPGQDLVSFDTAGTDVTSDAMAPDLAADAGSDTVSQDAEPAGPDVVETVCEPEPVEVDVPPGLADDEIYYTSGRVLDGEGNPIADLFVQPCTYTATAETCYKSNTDCAGNWDLVVDPPEAINAMHVRFVTDVYTPLNCRYELADNLPLEGNVATFAEPYVLFPITQEAATLELDQDAPVTVGVDNISFTVQADEWFPGIWETTVVRGLRYPLETGPRPCFVPEDQMPDELYVFTPDYLHFSTPGGVEVHFANVKELAPGAKVSLFVVGTVDTTIRSLEGDEVSLLTGEWYEYGTGTVSEDGSEIVSDPGSGMPGLGWIGYKVQE